MEHEELIRYVMEDREVNSTGATSYQIAHIISSVLEFQNQPERSKREDSMDKIYDEMFKRNGISIELSKEMRCSEHDGNVVRDK